MWDFLSIRKSYIALLVLTVVMAAILYSLGTGDRYALTKVVIDGKLSTNMAEALSLRIGKNIFSQDISPAAELMSRRQGVATVSVRPELPSTIRITTNDLSPQWLAHDAGKRELFGLDEKLRVVKITTAHEMNGKPALTGLTGLTLVLPPKDVRVNMVVNQLNKLESTRPDLYRWVTDVDFSADDYVTIGFAGLDRIALVTPGDLGASVKNFLEIFFGSGDVLANVRVVDMRFNGLALGIN